MRNLQPLQSSWHIAEQKVHFAGTDCILSTQRTIWMPAEKLLLISDLHLGKAAHFRKHALPIPAAAGLADLQRLQRLIDYYGPVTLVLLGDLFHSDWNEEWNLFSALARQNSHTRWILVRGNHDILEDYHYLDAGLELTPEFITGGISLIHDQTAGGESPYICGHVHPGYRLRGKGRQSTMLPGFHMNSRRIIMPAFGRLTGMVHLEKEAETDQVFCFTDRTFFIL